MGKSRVLSFFVGAAIGLVLCGTVYFAALGVKFYWYTEVKGYVLTLPPGGDGHVSTSARIELGPIAIESLVDREKAKCEFDEPLKYLNLIHHWYDSYEELKVDYLLLSNPNDKEELWGWSSCMHQPEDNWAACDVYSVKPQYVHADMAIDTLGHEVYHGACGDYHE